MYLGTEVFLWINKFIVDYSIVKLNLNLGEMGSTFIQYNSIFVIMTAIALFLAFLKLKISNKKIIKVISFFSKVSLEYI